MTGNLNTKKRYQEMCLLRKGVGHNINYEVR